MQGRSTVFPPERSNVLRRSYTNFVGDLAASILVLVVLGGAQARGSYDDRACSRAADLLKSESLRDKAWGAHWAADCQITALAGDIGAELARLRPDQLARLVWDSEGFWVARAMLDALIQLRQPLPAPVLEAIARGYPAEASILMLRNAPENQLLLAALRSRPGPVEWIAASNALARMRAPKFAATLLSELDFTDWAFVSDTGEALAGGMAGSILGGSPTMRVPSGFPPIGVYRLTTQAAPDKEMVSDGEMPVYMQRTLLEPGVERTLPWPAEGHCWQCLRIAYLAELGHVSKPEVEHAVEPHTWVKWTNLLQVSAAITQALGDQQNALRQLARALTGAGALAPAELDTSLPVELKINDQRSDRSAPLPSYPPVRLGLR